MQSDMGGIAFTVRTMLPHLFELALRQALNAHISVARVVGGANKFIQLGLKGGSVPILRVLNEEHHQESNDRGPRIYDELPGVGIVKNRAGDRPNEHGNAAQRKGRRPTG